MSLVSVAPPPSVIDSTVRLSSSLYHSHHHHQSPSLLQSGTPPFSPSSSALLSATATPDVSASAGAGSNSVAVAAAAAAASMASALPSFFTKHARSHSLDKAGNASNGSSSSSTHVAQPQQQGGASSGHFYPASSNGSYSAQPVSSNGYHSTQPAASNGHHSTHPHPTVLTDQHTLHPPPHASTSTLNLPSPNPSSGSVNSPYPPSTPSTATSSMTSAVSPLPSPVTFIRNGDVVYDHGPPPPAPLASVGTRNYTVLKEVGDGSFGTVWLADWHSPLALPKGTGPPGPSSRPEYRGKRLVALKRMKKAFEGGWDECMKLKELKSLRSIPMHPNIIPLYDSFLLPSSKELYFVFECMEGNLYQLTKSRKGRPLAAGLVANLFYQMLAGLHHIHACGYFHRDMKPENLLITTTGLADYPCYISPQHAVNNPSYASRPPEKDVVAIVKIADFGLARETRSRPPYTEYVSTRWYRAPEVLLRSRDYSNPVDMWAVGTILAEMVNLKPLFPGQSEVDQVYRICEVLGDPCADYGVDERNRVRGGGPWERGNKMAKHVGFAFPRITPVNFVALFDTAQVPMQLIDIMADLMRYDPVARLTTQDCLKHAYFSHIAPKLVASPVAALPNHMQHAVRQQQQQQQQAAAAASQSSGNVLPKIAVSGDGYGLSAPSPRDIPPSHSHSSHYDKPAFDVNPSAGVPSLPPPNVASPLSPYNDANYHYSAQANGHRVSIAPSLQSTDSHGLGGVSINVEGNLRSPTLGYPESVIDVNMDGEDVHSPRLQHSPSVSSPTASTYSFPNSSHQQSMQMLQQPSLPPPNPYRQGANGYATSTHSGSYYNPSVYSGHSGRRGSAGGASTFYDGSIFEGIAPTRAASILSFPATYGEAPPSPKFAQPSLYHHQQQQQQQQSSTPLVNPLLASLRQTGTRARNDADNFSVDFEREALQRSQNAGAASQHSHQPSQSSLVSSDSNESLKKGKEGKRGWMSSVFASNSHDRPAALHPQQQPLIVPAAFAAQQQQIAQQQQAQSSASSIYSHVTSQSGTSLKRTPSERSVHAPEPVAPAPTVPLDPKKAKKEAERLAKEAEKARRDAAQKAARDRARAVMQKRSALAQAADPLNSYTMGTSLKMPPADKEKQRMLLEAAARKQQALLNGKMPQLQEDARRRLAAQQQYSPDVRYKARRRDDDDDVHSMSSNETRSERRFSISSQNTISTVSTTNTFDSDPGRGRLTSPPLLAPLRRTPSMTSFSGQSRISVGSQNSGHSGTGGPSRRDISTSASNTSSLEYGLVGRFQGLTAAESPDQVGAKGQTSPINPDHTIHAHSPYNSYYQQTPQPQHVQTFSSSSAQVSPTGGVVLPGIHSFDRPPMKDFSFHEAPRSAQSQHSNNSTISGHSQLAPLHQQQQQQHAQGLPFTPEMYERQLQQNRQINQQR